MTGSVSTPRQPLTVDLSIPMKTATLHHQDERLIARARELEPVLLAVILIGAALIRELCPVSTYRTFSMRRSEEMQRRT